MVSASRAENAAFGAVRNPLTVVRLPEVNESPVKPDLCLLFSFAIDHAVISRIRKHECVWTYGLEPIVVAQVDYASN